MTSKINVLIAVVAVAVLGVVGYRSMTRTPQPPVASADSCAPEAIRKVVAPIERAILSARCDQRAAPKPATLPAAS